MKFPQCKIANFYCKIFRETLLSYIILCSASISKENWKLEPQKGQLYVTMISISTEEVNLQKEVSSGPEIFLFFPLWDCAFLVFLLSLRFAGSSGPMHINTCITYNRVTHTFGLGNLTTSK